MDCSCQGPDGGWAFLWGKRRHRRQETDLPVTLSSRAGPMAASAVNLSAGGALLRLGGEGLRLLAAGAEPVGPFGLQEALGPVFGVRLGPGPLAATADLVRVAWRLDEPDSVYVGCRFRAPLTSEQVRVLGLEERVCGAEADLPGVSAEEMRWQAPDGAGATLEALCACGRDLLHAGRLVAFDRRALAVRFEGTEPTRLVADLSHARFVARVVVGERVLWEEPAWLLGVRVLEDGGTEVVLESQRKPSRALRRLFRARETAAAG